MANVNGSETAQINSILPNEDHSEHYPKLLEYGLTPVIANDLDSVFKDGELKLKSILLVLANVGIK